MLILGRSSLKMLNITGWDGLQARSALQGYVQCGLCYSNLPKPHFGNHCSIRDAELWFITNQKWKLSVMSGKDGEIEEEAEAQACSFPHLETMFFLLLLNWANFLIQSIPLYLWRFYSMTFHGEENPWTIKPIDCRGSVIIWRQWECASPLACRLLTAWSG